MSFDRVWTALLLGALVAVPLALLLGAMLAMLLPITTLPYVEMTSVFLIGWGVATLACLSTRRLRVQWEIALWMGAFALFALTGCYVAVPGAASIAAINMALGVFLTLIAFALPQWLPAE